MKTANQLTTFEASLKLKPNAPTKVIFDHIDWPCVHLLFIDEYSALTQGAKGYITSSLS